MLSVVQHSLSWGLVGFNMWCQSVFFVVPSGHDVFYFFLNLQQYSVQLASPECS